MKQVINTRLYEDDKHSVVVRQRALDVYTVEMTFEMLEELGLPVRRTWGGLEIDGYGEMRKIKK